MDDSTAASFDVNDDTSNDNSKNTALINAFIELTSSSTQEAVFFLESHQWDLESAVSTFLDNSAAATATAATDPIPPPSRPSRGVNSPSPEESQSPDYSPSQSPSRSRSRSPSPVPSRAPYRLRSRGKNPSRNNRASGGIRTLADLNRIPDGGSGSEDDDEPQQYYTGGEKR